jgi:hypothetical protein
MCLSYVHYNGCQGVVHKKPIIPTGWIMATRGLGARAGAMCGFSELRLLKVLRTSA